MDKLTRNKSADLVQMVWATTVERAPESTQRIRLLGAVYYATTFDTPGIHKDHYQWLINALSDEGVQNTIDDLAERARAAGGEVAVPWRD